ncbi:hypothetical protein PITC_063710 [Penicillium italicum]|uniref:Uncharacterized protein n=1 Tax=Penicillium italicum TaxID=40296 RepID=A0A0A2KKZ1_PENIT|nr:hypothetical protein PITC_063710 [Penicillium italicum]
MFALNPNNDSMQLPKDTSNTNPLPLVDHLQNAQRETGPESASLIYEGFTFTKAMPKQGATWTCVKRTDMHRNQEEYFNMVQKRANKKSPEQQYQGLSADTRRAHINQLIDEQMHKNPLVEWSCVYAKEHAKISKARHSRCSDYEIVTMDVIIMQRPMKTPAYCRMSVGGSVAFGKSFQPHMKSSPIWSENRNHYLMPDQNGNILRPILQNLPSQLAQAMNPLVRLHSTQGPPYEYPTGQVEPTHLDVETGHPTGSQDQLRESARSTATINNRPASPAVSATNSSDISLENNSDCSWESGSDSDDASMISDESDEISAADDAETMETETKCQEPQLNQASFRQQHVSPYRRESSLGPHSRRRFQSRSLDRRQDRNYPLHDQLEMPPAKLLGQKRAERARSGSVPGKRYRMHLMNDNEIRSRLLHHREASLGHREKWPKRTFYEALQFEHCQSVRDPPAVYRCTCRCAIKEKKEAM